MDVDLLYGKRGLRVTLPPDAVPTVIEKPAMPVLDDPRRTIEAALDRWSIPAASSACILICDITRPVPNGLFLRPLIDRLIGSGIAADRITVLVATGLHRPNLGEELAEIVGDPWVLDTVQVVNHEARDDAQHVEVGRTSRGTVVKLDRRFVDAGLRIATALVEPHLMAGYSGGRKVVMPGVAHAETITTIHSHRFLSDPRAVNCVLDGNPLHEDQLEVVQLIGGALALNTVIDDKRRLAFFNCGEIVQSHLEAVAFMRRYAEVPVDRRFNTVLTSSAGYPLDKTYYQTIKGMVGPLGIVADGADLIVASECSEGLGSPEYRAAQQRYRDLGREEFMRRIAGETHAAIDEWQTQMLAGTQARANVSLFASGLDETERELAAVPLVDSIETAVATSIERHGDPHVAVIPEGPYVVPVMR